jgi:uncharacterized Zn-binding protein involved in type VI secretion
VKLVARETDAHVCLQIDGLVLPHVGGPIVPAAHLAVNAEGPQAARLADYAECAGPGTLDVVFEGAATVLVGGLPLAFLEAGTAHKGAVESSAATVEVGGPIFSLPPNIVVKGDSTFQNKTIRDLYFLSTLPSGKALLERLAASGQTVTIIPGADPHNSACSGNAVAMGAGIPTDSTIEYNPNVALTAQDANGQPIDQPPQTVLAHEMVHAMNNGEGNAHGDNPDPNPPASQPNIPEEEASAIGTGSHSNDYPTENSVRSDMGLPSRDNHLGADTSAPTGNVRPGGY